MTDLAGVGGVSIANAHGRPLALEVSEPDGRQLRNTGAWERVRERERQRELERGSAESSSSSSRKKPSSDCLCV